MQTFTAGQVNTIAADLLARADAEPITDGEIFFYLLALSGANAGKWFRGSDSSWQAEEAVAAAAVHQADGHWLGTIAAVAWTERDRYLFYAKESSNLHIAYSEEVREQIIAPVVNLVVESEVVR